MSNPSAVLEEKPAVAPMNAGILDGIHGPRATTSFPLGSAISSDAAWKQFQSLPMPARTDQAWRFSSVSALDLSSLFRPGDALSDADAREILERSAASTKLPAGSFLPMINFSSAMSSPEKLREAGVIFQPLERAMIEHEELFRRHFMSQPATLGSAKFAALHEAFVRSGTFLYVPRGVEVELPLETFHWLHARERRDFPAHAAGRRRAVQGHAGRTFPLDRSASAPASPAA